jgi:type III pantothenate kinase
MSAPIIAVDIGNTRIKLGLFLPSGTALGERLPSPSRSLAILSHDWSETELDNWLRDLPGNEQWWIASVNRPAAARLVEWIEQRRLATKAASKQPGRSARLLSAADLPIRAAVEHPDRVGIDRLAGAVAANRLRDPKRPAIIIGIGTAITVDLVDAAGTFCGGAILPGIGTSARALNEFTDLLPRSPLDQLTEPPPALGKTTLDAIHSGLYWGAVGGMRELIVQLTKQTGDGRTQPELFLTGGAAPAVARQLDPSAQYVEHLVLAGIALAANPPL